MGVDSGVGGRGFGGRGVCLLLSYSFPFFSFLGGVWVGGVQSQVVQDTVFFWGGGRSGGGRGRGRGAGGKKPVIVAMSFALLS